jgi:peroxiredoxin
MRKWIVAVAAAAMIAVAMIAMATIAGAVELPRKSPPIEIGLPGGKQLSIESYRGKAVVLAFILTTCPHCQHTTGILKEMQADYGARGLQVVEVAIDQAASSAVPGFIEHFQPNFPVGFATYDAASAYLQHPSELILHVPALVFIDRQGTIRAEYEGDAKFFSEDQQDKNMRAEIGKLLGGAVKKTASK